VLRRLARRPTGVPYYVLHLDALLLQCQYLHARGVPVLDYVDLTGARTRTHCSYTSAPYNAWPYVEVEGDSCCVLQLLGLTQFEITPRNPQIGQATKDVNWGELEGKTFTTLHHQ
jgi:hypothetical protein